MNVLAELQRRFTVRGLEVATQSVAALQSPQDYAKLVGIYQGLLEADRIVSQYLEEQELAEKR